MALTQDERKELLLCIEENQLVDDLFDHPGMKILLNKAEDMLNEYDRLDTIKDLSDLSFRKGQIDILKWLLSYQAIIRQTLNQQVDIVEHEVRLAKLSRGYDD